jgi:hypothetical protein
MFFSDVMMAMSCLRPSTVNPMSTRRMRLREAAASVLMYAAICS